MTSIDSSPHALSGWPDSSAGLHAMKKKAIIGTLSNGNVRLLVDMVSSSPSISARCSYLLIFTGETCRSPVGCRVRRRAARVVQAVSQSRFLLVHALISSVLLLAGARRSTWVLYTISAFLLRSARWSQRTFTTSAQQLPME